MISHLLRLENIRVYRAHLKKLRRAEGDAKSFGVFRVKNHDSTPKKDIFPILGAPPPGSTPAYNIRLHKSIYNDPTFYI